MNDIIIIIGTYPTAHIMINERNILAVFGLRLSPRNIVTARQMVASLRRLNLPNNMDRALVPTRHHNSFCDVLIISCICL
jgi:hypothetical protein